VNATVKYTLGRIGLFLAVLVPLLPVPINLLLKLMIAVLLSAVLALFLLRRWRDEMARGLEESARRRRADKDRLRAALAGDERDRAAERPERDQAAERPERDQAVERPGPDGDEPETR
jgi:hypothetical protein